MYVHVNGDHSGVGVPVVSLTGTVDVSDVAQVQRELLASLPAAGRGMVVDLRRATFADGTGIHALIAMRAAALRAGIVLVLAAPSDRVVRLLDGMGLRNGFRTADTPEKARALAALSSSSPAADPSGRGTVAPFAGDLSPGTRHGPAGALDVTATAEGDLTLLTIAGELELAGATLLMTRIVSATGQGSRVVVCDVSRLSVPGSDELLTVFPAAQRRSGPWPRSAVHLAGPCPDLAHRLNRMAMPRFVPVHSTVEAALSAAAPDLPVTRRHLALSGDPSSARMARAAVSRVWPGQPNQQEARQDALLIVTELATNAARHAGEPFTVSLALSAQRLVIAVTDSSRREPVVRPIQTEAPFGRGMQLVAGLSHSWGVRLIHDHGKTVWAVVDRRHDTGTDRAG